MQAALKFIVIVGATSAIAEQCARLWVQQGPVRLLLLARNRKRVEQVASDLRIRAPQSVVEVMTGNFEDAASIQSLVDGAVMHEVPHVVLIAHGFLANQQACQDDLAQTQAAIGINAISPVLFAEGFAKILEHRGGGTLGIIGSVAGDRGRKSNYVYGAAKGLIERYAEGMQHRFAKTSINVVLIKPGPTDTPMTASMGSTVLRLASPALVAGAIVSGIERGRDVVYAPHRWWLVMLIVRNLPRFVFNKLNI